MKSKIEKVKQHDNVNCKIEITKIVNYTLKLKLGNHKAN